MAYDPAIYDRGLFDVGRRARAGLGLVRGEWRSRRETPLGLAARLACMRRGFSSYSAALYGLDGPPDPALYVSDWHEGALAKRPNRRHGAMGDGKDSCAILTQGPLYPGVTAVAEPATRRAAVRVAY